MTMEIENFEFTIEDILSMHRSWITKLFIDDKKSEVEIVEQLYERRLVVTLTQIHQCLLDWNLIPAPVNRTQTGSTTSSSETYSDNWEVRQPRSSMSSVDMFLPSAHEEAPQSLEYYTTRPLPSPPTSSDTPNKHRSDHKRSRDKASKTLTRVTCHPGQDSRTRRPLDDCASPLDAFLEDQQSHERLAMGLNRVPRGFYTSEILRDWSSKTIVLRRSGTDQSKKDRRKDGHEKKSK